MAVTAFEVAAERVVQEEEESGETHALLLESIAFFNLAEMTTDSTLAASLAGTSGASGASAASGASGFLLSAAGSGQYRIVPTAVEWDTTLSPPRSFSHSPHPPSPVSSMPTSPQPSQPNSGPLTGPSNTPQALSGTQSLVASGAPTGATTPVAAAWLSSPAQSAFSSPSKSALSSPPMEPYATLSLATLSTASSPIMMADNSMEQSPDSTHSLHAQASTHQVAAAADGRESAEEAGSHSQRRAPSKERDQEEKGADGELRSDVSDELNVSFRLHERIHEDHDLPATVHPIQMHELADQESLLAQASLDDEHLAPPHSTSASPAHEHNEQHNVSPLQRSNLAELRAKFEQPTQHADHHAPDQTSPPNPALVMSRWASARSPEDAPTAAAATATSAAAGDEGAAPVDSANNDAHQDLVIEEHAEAASCSIFDSALEGVQAGVQPHTCTAASTGGHYENDCGGTSTPPAVPLGQSGGSVASVASDDGESTAEDGVEITSERKVEHHTSHGYDLETVQHEQGGAACMHTNSEVWEEEAQGEMSASWREEGTQQTAIHATTSQEVMALTSQNKNDDASMSKVAEQANDGVEDDAGEEKNEDVAQVDASGAEQAIAEDKDGGVAKIQSHCGGADGQVPPGSPAVKSSDADALDAAAGGIECLQRLTSLQHSSAPQI